MVQRLTYRRRHCYNTKSNGSVKVMTPGGKLTLHVLKKTSQRPKCGDCGDALQGMPAVRPKEARRLKKRQRKVLFACVWMCVDSDVRVVDMQVIYVDWACLSLGLPRLWWLPLLRLRPQAHRPRLPH